MTQSRAAHADRFDLAGALLAAAEAVPDAGRGLPDCVFQFVLKMTPMINVDLLIRDESGRALLAWRDDAYGCGWHVPGSIVRVNEPIAARIAATARAEIGALVQAEPAPGKITEFFCPRGHFISLLYRCRLMSALSGSPQLWTSGKPQHGMIAWIDGVPDALYPAHGAYAEILGKPQRSQFLPPSVV